MNGWGTVFGRPDIWGRMSGKTNAANGYDRASGLGRPARPPYTAQRTAARQGSLSTSMKRVFADATRTMS